MSSDGETNRKNKTLFPIFTSAGNYNAITLGFKLNVLNKVLETTSGCLFYESVCYISWNWGTKISISTLSDIPICSSWKTKGEACQVLTRCQIQRSIHVYNYYSINFLSLLSWNHSISLSRYITLQDALTLQFILFVLSFAAREKWNITISHHFLEKF